MAKLHFFSSKNFSHFSYFAKNLRLEILRSINNKADKLINSFIHLRWFSAGVAPEGVKSSHGSKQLGLFS